MDDVERIAREICDDRKLTFERAAGSGAFKRTYLVDGPDGKYALKLIVGAIDPQRVSREVEALRACGHRAICKLYDVGTSGGAQAPVLYLIEEFLPGGSLRELLATRLLTRDEGIEYGVILSDALAHLDERQIVHRDIKPDNIMLRADGSPVIVDLGLMRSLGDPSLTQTWLAQGPGTPAFAPPEQLRNEKAMINWRADQFSLGVTLSLSILGMHPYTGSAALERAAELVAERRPLSDVFVAAAKSCNLALLCKMVAPFPIQRFARPQQLRQQWEALRIER